MTTQTIIQPITSTPTAGILERRLPAVGALLSTPGFVQLCLSNGLAQSFGMRMQGIVVAWVVLELTGSRLWLGIVNGGPAIFIVLFSLLGGVLADSNDTRRVLLVVRTALTAAAFLATLLVTTGQVQIVHLMVYVFVVVGLAAVDMPVGRTLLHQVVGTPRIMGAAAAQSVAMNLVNIVAPLSIGVLIGLAGPGAAFAVLGVGYLAAAIVLFKSRVTASVEGRHSQPLADMRAGLAYLRSAPTVAALVSLGFLLPLAGVYFAMVPVFARDILHCGASGLGYLVSSFSVGSLVGALWLVSRTNVRRRGYKVAVLGFLFGAGMVAFSFSHTLLLSCAISLILGLIAAFWQNMLGALVQTVAAPPMRGRTLSIFTMGFQLASLGWLLGGVGSSLIGAEPTVAIAGVVFAGLSSLVFAVRKEAREID
jgi:predicted MFS family arabinose efflux permease